jgi:hypothetical protein
MKPNRPPTEWGERLLTVGLASTIATIGLVGLGLLVSVDHSDVGPTGRAPAAPATSTPKLQSPQIDSGFPSLELPRRSRTLEPVSTTPEMLAARNAEQCSRLEREIEALNARRRLSVTAAESNRLSARWHRLRNEADGVGCSRR